MMHVHSPSGLAPAVLSSGQAGADILHFSLEGLLPPEQRLALHRPSGTLVVLTCSAEQPYLLASCQFTAGELLALLPLLEAYPFYCPYEVLLAWFNSAGGGEEEVARCRRHLQQALQMGTFEQEMRPVRNVVSRTRLKLHTFGIDVISLLETGYLLRQRPARARKARESLLRAR
jgi:hypothetical protein